ncbi:ankyrin repeat domain-containing protein [Sunxiuqinia rutila]|uniref:ankyrin repeat domain-containing protein n=1 Tax=Sunxiuqinia rutila TaxID=1397841 RepID=UPI003D362337
MNIFVLFVVLNLLHTQPNPLKTTEMKQEQSALLEAVKQNKLQLAEEKLNAGADVNTRDENQRSLLLIATQARHFEMAQLLVAHGADVNQQDNQLASPFLHAGATGQTELLKLFLANGARFDVFNRYYGSALIPACERGHVETVRLLANTQGFPIDHINRLGWTALLEAIILGDGSARYQEIVQILIAAGCDISLPDGEGVTPLQHAKRANQTAIVKLLKEAASQKAK